jgi:hypothetical protein
MYVIEDEIHAEPQEGQFDTRAQAIAELRRRAALSWDEAPNRAPCADWRGCGRSYEVVEYDDTARPWKEFSRELVLEISADGVRWVTDE